MTPDTPPPEFFDRVQAGDRAATEEFVDRYGKVALALLRSRFQRITQAEREELVQQILLIAIKHLAGYDRSRQFAPWFLTIAKRRAMDFMRRHAREWVEGEFGRVPTAVSLDFASSQEAPEALRKQVRSASAYQVADDFGLEDDGEASATPAAEPLELAREAGVAAAFAERLAAVTQWIESRTPEERAVLGHYMHGASWDHVAEELARLGDPVSLGTARVRGHRLIAKAMKELGAPQRGQESRTQR